MLDWKKSLNHLFEIERIYRENNKDVTEIMALKKRAICGERNLKLWTEMMQY